MPTGGGKSLTFQIPALVSFSQKPLPFASNSLTFLVLRVQCLEGLTLVVSPLIALMKDQVQALKKRGVAAASMDSSLSTDEMSGVRSSLRNGQLKILYVAPER